MTSIDSSGIPLPTLDLSRQHTIRSWYKRDQERPVDIYSAGMNGYWRKTLNLELESSQRRYVSSYEIAVLHARLDEKELAFPWLEKAFEERSSALVYPKVDPRLDSLRSDPPVRQFIASHRFRAMRIRKVSVQV